MKHKNKFFKNSFMLVSAQIIKKLSSFFVLLYAARRLTVYDFGILVFAVSLVNIAQNFVKLGTDNLGIRNIAKDRTSLSYYVSHFTVIRLITGITVSAVIFFACILTGIRGVKLFTILILSLNFLLLTIDYHWAFIGQEKAKQVFAMYSVIAISYIVSATVLLKLYASSLSIVSAHIISVFMAYVFCIYILVKYSNFKFIKINLKDTYRISKEGIRIAFAVLGLFILLELNTLMISYINGDEAAAYYNAGFKFIIVFIFTQSMIIKALFPMLSHKAKHRIDYPFKVMLNRYILISAGFSFFGVIAYMLFAKNIIIFMFGEKYIYSYYILQIGSWTIPLFLVATSYCFAFISAGKERLSTICLLIGIAVNITGNFYLLPEYGIVGAIISLLIALIVVCFLYISVLNRVVRNTEKQGT